MKTLYTAHVTTIAGREGQSQSDDGYINLKLSRPGSNVPNTTNPEQLFAAAYSACFGGAIEAVARKQNINVGEVKVQADVALNQDDNNGYFITAALNVSLSGVDNTTAQQVVAAAHQVCPYSKATRGNIEVTLKVDNQPLAQAA
mgnify:CR=1 FL=1